MKTDLTFEKASIWAIMTSVVVWIGFWVYTTILYPAYEDYKIEKYVNRLPVNPASTYRRDSTFRVVVKKIFKTYIIEYSGDNLQSRSTITTILECANCREWNDGEMGPWSYESALLFGSERDATKYASRLTSIEVADAYKYAVRDSVRKCQKEIGLARWVKLKPNETLIR